MPSTDNYLLDPFNEVYEVSTAIDPLALIDTVIDKSFSLPNKAIQTPIIKCSIIANSKYSSILPLFVSYGPSGTGKSQLGKLVSGLYQLPSNYLLAGKTTPVAIRNLIQIQKYGEDWADIGIGEEDQCVLVWDDINLDILKDAYLLSILKSGYSRKSANIAIAQAGGTNMYFNCFAAKYTSTIHPFWTIGEFGELKRRTLIFPHTHYSNFDDNDKATNRHPDDLIDLDYIDFEGYKEMKTFEPDIMEQHKLKGIRISLRKRLKAANFPSDFGKLVFDLMCFGCLFGVFHDTTEAITAFENFYPIQLASLNEKSEFDYWLDRYLDELIAVESQLLQVVKLGEPIILSRAKLQRAIDDAIRTNEIPNSRYELAKVMRERGWKLIGETSNQFEKHV